MIMPVSDNPIGINQDLEAILSDYFQLKNAIFSADTNSSNKAAYVLNAQLNQFPGNELPGDQLKIKKTRSLLDSLPKEIQELIIARNIRGKRRHFALISMSVNQLIRTVGLKDKKIYWQYCPMANDDQGAFWLTDSSSISNPYFGAQMPDCGQTKETLQF